MVSLIAETCNGTVSLKRSLASYCPFHVFSRADFGSENQGTIKGKVFFNLTVPYGFMTDLQSNLCLCYSFVFVKHHILKK